MARPRVVVFGYGNSSRGDDGLGPALAARLAGRAGALADRCDLEVLEDFQLQVEHALDLEARDLALFLDASVAAPAPYAFQRVRPRADATTTTHELSPAAVLQVFRDIHGSEPPPSYLLSVRGRSFDLGAPLGAEASRHLEAAWRLLQRLLADPRPQAWDSLGGPAARERPCTNCP